MRVHACEFKKYRWDATRVGGGCREKVVFSRVCLFFSVSPAASARVCRRRRPLHSNRCVVLERIVRLFYIIFLHTPLMHRRHLHVGYGNNFDIRFYNLSTRHPHTNTPDLRKSRCTIVRIGRRRCCLLLHFSCVSHV